MDHSSEAEEISMTMAHLNHKLVLLGGPIKQAGTNGVLLADGASYAAAAPGTTDP
jgi:hypothetical protein